jgi:hypothetical protein
LYNIFWLFSSPCHRQRDLLPSLGVRRLLTFRILIFSSETPHPNELKLGRKHRYGRSSIKITISSRSVYKHRCHRKFLFLVCRFLKHLKLLSQMDRNLVGSTYERFRVKYPLVSYFSYILAVSVVGDKI